ncbi:hypothetical protein HYH03_005585 [Edaphochlamys debaryana]|uniref:Uncharacterized protein n=1 Tax=Edaphochlamys debaryana TaxID=47281 RepID=A0A835YCI9_9CHLO|nr:hypothetical protein HYH03_005585 [Edaphochlamys debaryana]|eukprot:KAG2496355.1 hypothetical protein HYH03_005585 [Edaphochlamys debaryana]
MAQAKATGFSSKVLGLRFMQRAAEKRKLEEDLATSAAAAEAAAAAEDAPQAPEVQPDTEAFPQQPSTSGRCVITYEPVPVPGLAFRSGRMSFGPNAGKPAAAAATTAAAASQQQDTSVSDAEMAKAATTFRKPAEMAAWQPTSLRIYDTAAASGGGGGGAGTGGGGGDGDAKSGKSKPQKQGGGGGGGGKQGGGQAGSKGGKGAPAAPAANAFAPLRPPKRQKT